MNDFKKQHSEKKQKICDCLNKAESFFSENGYDSEASSIHTQMENLINGCFSIAVVGEFSAGKSTFLNALMGEKLLPSFTKETTATVNFLRHKNMAQEGEAGRVYYNDGQEIVLKEADSRTIAKYVSTASSEDVAQKIRELDLFIDSKFLEGNVTLVDTPGLNGVAEGHKEITQQQIERSSAGIFMFNANQPGSKTDFEFLSDLRKHVKNIILVLNQIDCIHETEDETVESVVENLKKNYKNNVSDATTIPEIIPISAYLALIARSKEKLEYQKRMNFTKEEKAAFEKQSNMEAFEDRLWKYLTQGDKAKQELIAPLEQLLALLGNINISLNNKLKVLEGSVDSSEIDKQKLELEQTLTNLQEQLIQITREMESGVQLAENEYIEKIKAESRSIIDRNQNKIDNFIDLDDIDPNSIQKRLEWELQKLVEEASQEYYDSLRAILINQTGSISSEINQSLKGCFDIKIDTALELPEITHGIEEFELEQKRLTEELECLKAQEDNADISLAEKLSAEKKKKQLERKLDMLEEQRDTFAQNAMALAPPVVIHQERKTEKRWRTGLLGIVTTVLLGRKTNDVFEEVVDREERDNYLKEIQRIKSEKENEIKKLENELEKYEDNDPDSMQRKLERIQRKELECQGKINARIRDFNEKMKRENEGLLRKQKRKVSEYVEEVVHKTVMETNDDFAKRRGTLLELMKDSIGKSVSKQIKLKQDELDILIKDSQNAVSECNEQIKQIQTQLDTIVALQKEAYSIHDEIEAIPIDEIAEEDI